jgi:hypothetical protein
MSISPGEAQMLLLPPLCRDTLRPDEMAGSISYVARMATELAIKTIDNYNEGYDIEIFTNPDDHEEQIVSIYRLDVYGRRYTNNPTQEYRFTEGVLTSLVGYNNNQYYFYDPERQTIRIGSHKTEPVLRTEMELNSEGAYLKEFMDFPSGTFLDINYSYDFDEERPGFSICRARLTDFPHSQPFNNADIAKIFPMGREITIEQLLNSVIDIDGDGGRFGVGGVRHPRYTNGNLLGYNAYYIYDTSDVGGDRDDAEGESESEIITPLINGHAYPINPKVADNTYLAIVGINSGWGEFARAIYLTIDSDKIEVVTENGSPVIKYEIIVEGKKYNLSHVERRGKRVAKSELGGREFISTFDNEDGSHDYLVLLTADDISEEVSQGWYRESIITNTLKQIYLKNE